jgi:hypothetical protein
LDSSTALSPREQVTDRFTQALERLGSTALYGRIGGVYCLAHVMRASAERYNDVIGVLVAFGRARPGTPVVGGRGSRAPRRLGGPSAAAATHPPAAD